MCAWVCVWVCKWTALEESFLFISPINVRRPDVSVTIALNRLECNFTCVYSHRCFAPSPTCELCVVSHVRESDSTAILPMSRFEKHLSRASAIVSNRTLPSCIIKRGASETEGPGGGAEEWTVRGKYGPGNHRYDEWKDENSRQTNLRPKYS